jgi:hypothetical protein
MDDQVFLFIAAFNSTNPEHEREVHKILVLRGKLLAMQTTKNLPEHTVVVAVAERQKTFRILLMNWFN